MRARRNVVLDHPKQSIYLLLNCLGEGVVLSLLARIRSLLRGVRRGDALNDDMEAEFRLHLELRAEDLMRAGLTPAEAARQARLEFGSVPSFRDRGREARGLRAFDSLRFSMLDLKLGGRMLHKHPALDRQLS